ncbi:MAG: hypothetical protein AAGA60_28230 [Cyanobacteria bacterium P01_E01_bin.42]
MIDILLDKIGDWNPQLLRELKGRLTLKNILIAVGISLVVQILFYLGFSSNSYGNSFPSWVLYLFITLSIVGIIILQVGGVYVLMDDLQREEKRGTLNFIRLSPQTSRSILCGKILGVPILVYLGILLAIPLHICLGIYAAIPTHHIVAFYILVAVNCFLFYSAALLFTLFGYSPALKGSLGFVGSIFVFFFTSIFAIVCFSPSLPFPIGVFNWVSFFYPGYFLHFLLSQTPHASDLFYPSNADFIKQITWFGLPLWSNAISAFLCTLVNYFLVISWIWNGLERCFHDRTNTGLSKKQSYWLSGILTLVLMGFSLENIQARRYLMENLSVILIVQFFILCGLIIILSPHRTTLQVWSRYRHQITSKKLLWDLILEEKSPAHLAILLNSILTSTILLVALFLSSLTKDYNFDKYRIAFAICLFINSGVIFFYSSLVQWIFLQKFKQRLVVAIAALFTLFSLHPVIATVTDIVLVKPVLLITSIGSNILPTILLSLVGQGIAIVAINLQMTRQLRHLGESEIKELLSGDSRDSKQLSDVA